MDNASSHPGGDLALIEEHGPLVIRRCGECMWDATASRAMLCPDHTLEYARSDADRRQRGGKSEVSRVHHQNLRDALLHMREKTGAGRLSLEDLEDCYVQVALDCEPDAKDSHNRPGAQSMLKALDGVREIKKIEKGGDAVDVFMDILRNRDVEG